jgi:hypothetical protein
MTSQKLRLFLWIGFGANAYSFVQDPWVQWCFIELSFGLYNFFALCQFAFCQVLSFVLLWLLSQKMHILVTWREALPNVFGFLIAPQDGSDSESCWYFKTQIC